MKALALFFFAISLYLLPNPTHSTPRNPIRLPTAASDTPPVFDAEGDALLPGRPYFLRSWKWTHGGLRLVSLDGATTKCPSDVIIGSEIDDDENPVMFTPADPNAAVVFPSTLLNIKFAPFPTVKLCVNNVSWEVQYDPRFGERFVKAGDVFSHQFKIVSVAPILHTYIITYCESGTDNCYDVGSHYDDQHTTRLALSTDWTYQIVFQKAPVAGVTV